MRVAIMQPTYLPWIGYFGMMDRVKTFVILDSVQFAKRSWQQRNRIKTQNGPVWLTVPVITKGRRSQLIREVQIDSSGKFPEVHIQTIVHTYGKSPFFAEYSGPLFEILRKDQNFLAELNVELISWLKEVLSIKAHLVRSSQIKHQGKQAEILAEICENLGADEYLSAPGSREYIEESNSFKNRDIRVIYHEYDHPQYRQSSGQFFPYMSIIDLLFNEGPNSLSILRKGYQEE